ncbi:MAG TPA: hypothetical protein VKP30_07845, partial [Polyangiaceae bacterium]|nr:hypothetical protein [Polyangiaceae bacterium]
VADCVRTPVITTSDSCRLPGANHIALPSLLGGHDHASHDHASHDHAHHDHAHHDHASHDHAHHRDDAERSVEITEQLSTLGERIVREAIRSHVARRGVPRKIPDVSVAAEVGYSAEAVLNDLGGASRAVDLIRAGQIRGIVNLVGCNNPKVLYERTIVDVAQVLLDGDVLVLTNGCASFALLKAGYCQPAAIDRIGSRLRQALTGPPSLPPVIHLGECLDNARASGLFRALSDELGIALNRLPFAFASPEWSNEKGVGAALSFRLLGLNSYHCVRAPTFGSEVVERFLEHDTQQLLGSVMVVETEPVALGRRIVNDLELRRQGLGWT